MPCFFARSLLLVFLCAARAANAATAEQWRSRSIYQCVLQHIAGANLPEICPARIIVDRFALPSDANPNACDPARQTWCGGTWNTIRENLDYIHKAGFTAIWISPVSQNYEGPRTPYGDAYHGYWIADVTKLNRHFGTSNDLKALANELHRRGMYLMVDVVVNNVMATSTKPDLSAFLFKDESLYHPYCPIDWNDDNSVQTCWLGDTTVMLPDVKTEDPKVVQAYQKWIKQLVEEYNIDGLRIDGKHVNTPFWPQFCSSAGVFCIGEVFDGDAGQAAQYQGPQALDSILHYPMYGALTAAFTIPGPQNMSAVVDMINQSNDRFTDPTLLGNFLENQDLPRWANLSVDPQSLYNAIVYNFMSDGIPIVYYGQEQGFHGNADPWNREPLWTSGYVETTAYTLITKLNQIRNFLNAIALQKGKAITVVTNIGSPPQNMTVPVYTPWSRNSILTEVLSCTQYSVGSAGTIQTQYYKGGQAGIFMRNVDLVGSELCGFNSKQTTTGSVSSVKSSASRRAQMELASLALTMLLLASGTVYDCL